MKDRDLPPPGSSTLLAAFGHAATWRLEADRLEAGAITQAREDGWTWRQIAAALALDSPQAAHQRLGTLKRRIKAAEADGRTGSRGRVQART